jgi:hypothetical protein
MTKIFNKIIMSCHFECNNINEVFLVYPILHRNWLNQEFVGSYLFCSKECRNRFIEESTYIENEYTYYMVRKEHPDGYKPSMMQEVEEYKKNFGLSAMIKTFLEKQKALQVEEVQEVLAVQ